MFLDAYCFHRDASPVFYYGWWNSVPRCLCCLWEREKLAEKQRKDGIPTGDGSTISQDFMPFVPLPPRALAAAEPDGASPHGAAAGDELRNITPASSAQQYPSAGDAYAASDAHAFDFFAHGGQYTTEPRDISPCQEL